VTAARRFSVEEHVDGLRAGDRVMLGRTITLVESTRAEDNDKALAVLERILPRTGGAMRLGITGVPGVGKSSFIEALGMHLIEAGHRIAVLAIDPSSRRSGGSIMGDKTRMERLGRDERAFIRPSPSAGSLGGVARKTREALLLCEAAGHDVIIVETVGVGQSETVVHSMVDFFLLLLLPNAGDLLQGIKRGIMELADAVAVNKADGANLEAARRARAEFELALHYLPPSSPAWHPPACICSALDGTGIAEIWERVLEHRRLLSADGELERKRREQSRSWMYDSIHAALAERFFRTDAVRTALPELERRVMDGSLSALSAADALLRLLEPERDGNR
jgi:LAO/AO transport system kinase